MAGNFNVVRLKRRATLHLRGRHLTFSVKHSASQVPVPVIAPYEKLGMGADVLRFDMPPA